MAATDPPGSLEAELAGLLEAGRRATPRGVAVDLQLAELILSNPVNPG